MSLSIGSLICEGKYRILARVGDGGSAVVYRAENIETEKEVAIKVIPTNSKNSRIVFREASTSTNPDLRSDFIAEVYETTIGEGCVYIVMKYYEQGDLKNVIDICSFHNIPIPEELAKSYGRDILSALVILERCSFAHRDLKPANLLFNGRSLCLGDFGTTKSVSQGTLAGQTTMRYSLGYTSPEQIKDEKAAASSTDIFSFGIIMYQLITRRLPFTTSLFDFPKAVEEKAFIPIPEGLCSKELADLIASCLQFDPSLRPTASFLLAHPAFAPTPSMKEGEIGRINAELRAVIKEKEEILKEVDKLKSENLNLKKEMETSNSSSFFMLTTASKVGFTGRGKYIYPDGAIYEGEWKNGSKEAYGKHLFEKGNQFERDSYEGQ